MFNEMDLSSPKFKKFLIVFQKIFLYFGTRLEIEKKYFHKISYISVYGTF